MLRQTFLSLTSALFTVLAASAADRPYVRITHDQAVPACANQSAADLPGLPQRGSNPCCAAPAGVDSAAHAWHGQPDPDGGTLAPVAWANPAAINAGGEIAFMAQLEGVERNQGIFVADGESLKAIAIGCGGGGGSGNPGSGVGDPSPLGGTFCGFFGGTSLAPTINDLGDVLFLADVDGGSAPRGLFLYRAASDDIVTVAAVGDPSPVGGTLLAVGPGSMNNVGQIVFLAKNSDTNYVNILKWTDGVVTKHVAVGDIAPGNRTFGTLAGESLGFVDGTTIPTGDVPDINDAGQVSFFALVQGGQASRGLFVTTAGVHEWYVSNIDTTPIGGVYLDFQAPHLNASGEMAFFADVNLGEGLYNSGWFVGTPGNWRNVLAFYDEIAGGQVCGQAISRNPMQPLDDCGNLVAWCRVRYPDLTESELMLILPPEGEPLIVAQEGDLNVLGGTIGTMNPWPSMNSLRQGMLSCSTPGTPGDIYTAHFVFSGWLPGDLDGDEDVDLGDLAQLLANYGTTGGATYHDGDLDGDEDVDPADLAALLALYGVDCT
jgi:hypothetical protein